jgi:regulator of sirC expression with transglutaminase-like and TPR domain
LRGAARGKYCTFQGNPMGQSIRSRFAALATGPDDRIDLDEAALLIAAEEYEGLDVAGYLARLDELADRVRRRAAASDHERIAALNEVLFREARLAGNTRSYYDPRNSFLNQVLDRRRGIPISLGVVYMEVGRRLELPIAGVNLPGHFVVRYPGPEAPAVLDPFFAGAVVPDETLRERIRRAHGGTFDEEGLERLLDVLLAGAAKKDILVRMLANLKWIYLQREDAERALAAMDRILLLAPDAAEELRDRGALYRELECFSAALADFQRYLVLAPDGEHAPTVRAAVADLQRQVAHIS